MDLGLKAEKADTSSGIHCISNWPKSNVHKTNESTILRFLSDNCPMIGFDPLVNQRLLPPTFPRYSKIKDRSSSLEYFLKLVDNLLTVCYVTEISDLHAILVRDCTA